MRLPWGLVLAGAAGIGAGVLFSLLVERDPGAGYTQIVSLPTRARVPAVDLESRNVTVENGEEFDFGVMDREESREHTFHIRNHTDQPLRLEIVDTTCKCTVGERPNGAIPPGEVGDVTLKWTAKSYESEFRQSATIETSDEVRRVIQLSVFGRIQQLLSADPPNLVFSDVPFGEEREQTILVQSMEEPALDLLQVEWSDLATREWFAVDTSPAPSDRLSGRPLPLSGLLVRVKLRAGMPLGRFDQTMTLQTNAEKREPLHIAVEGNVTSDVMIVGQDYKERKQELQLGANPQGTELVRQLRVIAKGAHRETFKIIGVESSPDDLIEAELGEVRDLNDGVVRMQMVTIRIPKDSRVCRFVGDERSPAGQVTLHTTHPVAKTLTIRVLFAVLPREKAGGRR